MKLLNEGKYIQEVYLRKGEGFLVRAGSIFCDKVVVEHWSCGTQFAFWERGRLLAFMWNVQLELPPVEA